MVTNSTEQIVLVKEGGVAIYIKSKFSSSVHFSMTKAKQFELLTIKVGVSKDAHITVIGCYRPPSATKDSLPSLSEIMHQLGNSECIILGDFNWDWLSCTSDHFKELCDSFNFKQLIGLKCSN